MCRLIAFASAAPQPLAPWLAHLARLGARGNLVEGWERRPGGNHPDGWGAAWRENGAWRVVRSGLPAPGDPALPAIRAGADRFIGHVRYASDPATVDERNAHPFEAGGIMVAHNGTFRGAVGEEAARRGVSDTLVFCERLAAVWADRTLAGLARALSALLSDRALVGDYSAANLLVGAGGDLFALRLFRRRPEYYTLFLRAAPGEAAAASEPLGDLRGWRPLDNGELVALDPFAPAAARVAVSP